MNVPDSLSRFHKQIAVFTVLKIDLILYQKAGKDAWTTVA